MGEANSILADVSPDHVFRVCNGVVLHNLHELISWLESSSEYDFRYHVNNDHHKNDFAIWVRETINDKKLAEELDGELDKERYILHIKKRLQELA